MTRSPAQQEKVCGRTQAEGFIVNPCRDTKIFRCFREVGGEMGEGAPAL